MTIVAILTCHNRRDLTVRCLKSFFVQSFAQGACELRAVVVDDGSTDGTTEAVEVMFERVDVVAGDGTLFWARGMQRAETRAMAERPDFLLWLNDDVTLAQGALDRMVTTANSSDGSVVVGGLVDPVTAEVTYSGVLLSRWHPLRVRLVHPTDQPLEADTFNGNVVLVPRSVYERVGPIDGAFAHGQADFDYGLRARRAGFRVLVAPAPVGTCPRGGTEGTFYDTSLPLKERWDLMQRPTGLPMGSHARYLQRHGGPLWPVFWAAPYAKLLLSGLVAMATGHARRPKRRGQGQA